MATKRNEFGFEEFEGGHGISVSSCSWDADIQKRYGPFSKMTT